MHKLFFLFVLPIQLPLSAESVDFRKTTTTEQMDTVHIKGIVVYGKSIDNQTRCVHYHSALDIIAIKFKCCDSYFPCYSCHEETTNHEAKVWPVQEFNAKAILCGACGNQLSISDYMACDNTCPACSALFNPGCKNHYHLYFETKEKK